MNDDLRDYFAVEARELLEQLTLASLHVERSGGFTPEQRRHVLRLAHTLKGAARVVGATAIADAAHAIEDVVAATTDTPAPALGSQLLQLIDVITAVLPPEGDVPAALPASPPAAAPPTAAGAAEEPIRAVRVELSAIDRALERVADMTGRCGALREAIDSRSGTRIGSTHATAELDRLTAEVGELRSQLHEMRLAPAIVLFTAVERAVRDAAEASLVRARFVSSGGEHRVDADLLASVRDAMIQLARNAVAHGIEAPAVRATLGKPEEGLVTLAIEREGADVAFSVSDDGRGLDLAALRRAAREAGMGAPGDAPLDDDRLIALLLEGGLSSRGVVSQISGRGVGLDLVRSVAARLGGRVSLRHRAGHGVTVSLLAPVSLRSLRYLRVESDGRSALLPLDAVLGTARLADTPQVAMHGRSHLMIEDQPVAHLSLRAILRNGQTAGSDDERVLAVVTTAAERVALTVERFGETAVTIAQSLPPLSGADPVIRGYAIDGAGRVVPVLEPAALTAAARGADRAATEQRRRRRPRLLVVDDSITTRMLEQSILEGAGYDVDAVASAEEGLARAAMTPYDLFIVDVEMPGMNGFEFVAATRGDEALSRTPAMLVTSRSAEADRRRGLDAGARAYIVKGEFDQDVFLSTVRGLVG
jgi:two-component system chemotaxis sensor kinase CheA